ncbi:MAG: cell wall-binding repeat-containing protein [Gracilibacteraceae bacterium]|nr:cell wall-binding repeat-containing protein [Gracilibacteraceae bacterium]
MSKYVEATLALELNNNLDSGEAADYYNTVTAYNNDNEVANLKDVLIGGVAQENKQVNIKEATVIGTGIAAQTHTIDMKKVVGGAVDLFELEMGVISGINDLLDGAGDIIEGLFGEDIADIEALLNLDNYNIEALQDDLDNATTAEEALAIRNQALTDKGLLDGAVESAETLITALRTNFGDLIPAEIYEGLEGEDSALSAAKNLATGFGTLASDASDKYLELLAEDGDMATKAFIEKTKELSNAAQQVSQQAADFKSELSGTVTEAKRDKAQAFIDDQTADRAKTKLAATKSDLSLEAALSALIGSYGEDTAAADVANAKGTAALELANGNYNDAVIAMNEALEFAKKVVGDYDTIQGSKDIIADFNKVAALLGNIGAMLSNYAGIDFSNADAGVNTTLDFLEADLKTIKEAIESANRVSDWLLAANPTVVDLIETTLGIDLSDADLSAVIAGALSAAVPQVKDTISGLLNGGGLESSQVNSIISALEGLIDTDNLFSLDDLASNIDDALVIIGNIKIDYQFGTDVKLQEMIDFTNSIIDGGIAARYENLDIDSLKDVGVLLEYIREDLDTAISVVMSADIIDKNLRTLLGDNTVSGVVFGFLSDTLPGLIDGLLDSADLDDYIDLSGTGSIVKDLLSTLADADVDATGTALEYLGYVSEALDDVIDIYGEITELFTYNGEYIQGLDLPDVLDALGLDGEALVKLFDGILDAAAGSVAGILDEVGIDADEKKAQIRAELAQLIDNLNDFGDFVTQLEAIAGELNGLYDLAAGYLTETEIEQIAADIWQYWGDDITAELWKLLESEASLTQKDIDDFIERVAQGTAEFYENNVKPYVDIIAYFSTLTDVELRAEAIKAVTDLYKTYLEDRVNGVIADYQLDEAWRTLQDVYAGFLSALEKAQKIYDCIDGISNEDVKAFLQELADRLVQAAIDELTNFANELKDLTWAEIQNLAREISADLRAVAQTLEYVYDLAAGATQELISELKALIRDNYDPEWASAAGALIEEALSRAWEDISAAAIAFWHDGDVTAFRETVEARANQVYGGLKYVADYIKANGEISIAAENGTGDVFYTLSANYDELLNADFFGEPVLGSAVELLNKLGFTLEYRLDAASAAAGFSIANGNEIVGLGAAAGSYDVGIEYYLVYGAKNQEWKLAATEVQISIVQTHTVTFVDYDDTVLKTETVNHGDAATAPADPTRDGYTFTGWNVPFANITSDLTVTATYTPVATPPATTYTVTVINGTADNSSYAAGDTVTVTANAAPAGQRFRAWTSPSVTFTDSTSETTTFTMPAYAVTVTANYEPIPVPSAGAYRVDPDTTLSFGTVSVGYAPVAPQTVTVYNTGGTAWTNVSLTLTGADPAAFAIPAGAFDVSANGYTSFEVSPVNGLPVGSYSVSLIISNGNETLSVTLSFTVAPLPVSVSEITLPAPVRGAAPALSIDNDQFSGTVTWSPAVGATFATRTSYTATITLIAKDGYTLDGIDANFFTIPGATSVTYDPATRTITAVFPQTAGTSSSGGSGGGLSTVIDEETPLAALPSVSYIYGADRVETAIAISKAGWTSAEAVILAPGDNDHIIDALSVSSLAGQDDAPILLVLNNSIRESVFTEIARLGASKAYVVGSLGQGVADQLKARFPAIEIIVLQGANRVETAKLINARVTAPQGTFVVGYSAIADAVSAASFAAANGYVIQIAASGGVFSGDASLGGYVLGGPTLVQDVSGLTRIYGADRYATNQGMRDSLTFMYDNVYFANGVTLVDALTGSALAAKSRAVILLTPQNDPTNLNLGPVTPETRVYGFGGPAA